jgi:hypothetical protein
MIPRKLWLLRLLVHYGFVDSEYVVFEILPHVVRAKDHLKLKLFEHLI